MASGCRWSRRFAMAHSMKPRCGGWCGIICAARSTGWCSPPRQAKASRLTPAKSNGWYSRCGTKPARRASADLPRPVRQQHPRAMLDTLDRTAGWPIDGYLISCPYYSRPSQRGLELHFRALADRAAHPVVLYNIPYRTGVNLGNEAMLRLAAHPNIVGLKDCCADREPVARPAAPALRKLRRSDRRGRAVSWRR